jgi:YHS domain-containing protein
MKKSVLSLFLLSFLACSAQKSQVFQTGDGAIRGYDPVEYFKEKTAVKGMKQFSYSWNGAEWHFVSDSNLLQFKASPEKYAPQYGGYCAYGLSEGHKAPTEPDAWSIINGKLYLNYNQKVRDLWRKDHQEKIDIADKNWPNIKDKE